VRATKRHGFFVLIVGLTACNIVARGGDTFIEFPIHNPCDHAVTFKVRIGRLGPPAETLTIEPKGTLLYNVGAPGDTVTLDFDLPDGSTTEVKGTSPLEFPLGAVLIGAVIAMLSRCVSGHGRSLVLIWDVPARRKVEVLQRSGRYFRGTRS
jgi:hypothetical protein